MLTDSTWLIPDWPELPANVAALSTLRGDGFGGGFSRTPYDDGRGAGGLNLGSHVGDCPEDVARNRARLQEAVGVPIAWLSQVHGFVVVDAAKTLSCPEADASIVAQAGLACAILTADCLPILLADTHASAWCARHHRLAGASHRARAL